MRLWHSYKVAIAAVFLTIAVGSSSAQGSSIPGIPSVPGLDPQKIAIQAAARQLTPWVDANQPIIRDWNAVFPTVATLPGQPFSPIKDPEKVKAVWAALQPQLAHSNDGIVKLPPGDYAFPIGVFCTSWYDGNIHRGIMGARGVWVLGPLRGSRADILAAMYARASAQNLSFSDVQTLSWVLQAGMRYDEFPARSQRLVDQLIPDFKDRLLGSFPDQVQARWNQLAATVPGLPSFDSALSSAGGVGQTVVAMRNVRDEIVAEADNFDALSHTLAPPGGQDEPNVGEQPWSIISPNAYERLITEGFLGSTATLEVRLTTAEGSSEKPRELSLAEEMLGDAIVGAQDTGGGIAFPFSGTIDYPKNRTWQPLSPCCTAASGPPYRE